jgi:hypothetical protein
VRSAVADLRISKPEISGAPRNDVTVFLRRADQASLLTSPAEVGGVNGLVADVEAVDVFAVLALLLDCPPD